MKFKKIAIIGLGLIGGSLALAIKKKKLAKKIVGVSKSSRTVNLAKRCKLVDQASRDLKIIKGADLVILATPVDTILKLAPRVNAIVDSNCIVTDVGSTKRKIVSSLDKIFVNFLGSHPLAGSEKKGLTFSDPDIFKDSICIITPTKSTKQKALTALKRFWDSVGTKLISMPVDEHDKVLSFSSHLPHIVAFSLISTVPEKYLTLAAGGLKDTTRVASSDTVLWENVFFSNKDNLIRAINLFQDNIGQIKKALQTDNRGALRRMLESARKKRENLT